MKVILYARFSPRPDAKMSDSVVNQLDRLRKWAEFNEHQIVGEFEDSNLSGKSVETRPGFMNAMKRMKAERGLAFCVTGLSRFSRSAIDCLNTLKEIQEAGGELVSLKDHIDTSSPMGRFIFTIMAACAQLERETIVQRTREGLAIKKAQGVKLGKPFGGHGNKNYKTEQGGRVILSPEQAACVQEILYLRDIKGWPFPHIQRRIVGKYRNLYPKWQKCKCQWLWNLHSPNSPKQKITNFDIADGDPELQLTPEQLVYLEHQRQRELIRREQREIRELSFLKHLSPEESEIQPPSSPSDTENQEV